MAATHEWIWHELMTTDPKAAARFYGEVLGWRIDRFPAPEDAPAYLVGHVGDRGVVGIMAMPAGVPAGTPPNWSGYVHTADVESTSESIAGNGGKVLRPPFDIPGVGRIAVVADPEGGVFNLLEPGRSDAPPMRDAWTPGSIAWCELHSNDPEQNFGWYQKLFGWEKGQAHDMGSSGTYQLFSTGGSENGGSCGKMGQGMPTHWLFYFAVTSIEAAIDRVSAAGGRIFMGPHEVPGNTWIAMGNDPQGAIFALHSQTK